VDLAVAQVGSQLLSLLLPARWQVGNDLAGPFICFSSSLGKVRAYDHKGRPVEVPQGVQSKP
jgi:hypothetical protein